LIGRTLLILTNKKLHTGYPLVPKLVTLNDLEPLRCFIRWLCWGSNQVNYIQFVEGSRVLTRRKCSSKI